MLRFGLYFVCVCFGGGGGVLFCFTDSGIFLVMIFIAVAYQAGWISLFPYLWLDVVESQDGNCEWMLILIFSYIII